MSEGLFDLDPTGKPLARATDPATSHAGAMAVRLRAGSQKHALLMEVYRHGALTADEAGNAADLLHTGYWKRISDLLNEGLLEPVLDSSGYPLTRPGRSGSGQRVLQVTDRGREALR